MASLVSPVLVGRQAEVGVLAGALYRAADGQPGTVLIGGEAGVGKSRLVNELVDRARSNQTRVLIGSCVELDGGGIPLAPLVDMLRALAAETPAHELDALLGQARGEIGRLVPELDDGETRTFGEERDPARLLELIIGVVGRLAAERSLVLVFEDVQWADPATLDLIALLVSGANARRLLLVFTARSDELHRAHPFRRMAARWEQQRIAQRLELQRLDSQDVAAQITAILGERPDGGLVEFVAGRSEGIPLFVEELLGAMRDGGIDRDYLPPSLRDVVLARIERLSANGQHVLRVASAAARWVPDDLLTAVLGLPDADLNTALREAVEQQLLVVDESGRGYGFRHALAKAAIHDDLLPGERARLHKTYAEAIEQSAELDGSELDVISMLAHHWLAAHNLPRAIAASVRAGQLAAAAAAPAAAQRHFEIALELWPQVQDATQLSGIDHPRLLEAAAGSSARAGAVDRALGLIDEAIAEVGDRDEPERRAMLLVHRAAILGDLGRDDEALAVAAEAESLLDPDARTEASAHVLVAYVRSLTRVDQFTRAGELAQRALDAARAAGATTQEIDAQHMLGVATVYGGDLDRGFALMQESVDRARREGLTWIASRVCANLADMLMMHGRYEEAIATLAHGMTIAEQSGLTRTAGAFMRGNTGEALLRLGRWDEAMASLAAGTVAAGVFAGNLALLRAELHVLSGRRDDGASELREARRHLRTTSAAQFALPLAWIEAEIARSGGDLHSARTIIQDALARERDGEDPRYRWPVMSLGARVEAELALRAHDTTRPTPDDALRRAAALRDGAHAMPATTPQNRGHLALVDAEYARAQRSGEIEAWQRAADHCGAMNERYPLAYALLRLAEALSEARDPQGAAASAREALELARSMGAAPLVDDVEALVRRARLDVQPDAPTRAPAAPGTAPSQLAELGLTAREIEVLRLVADGRSNSQIAEELFISRKTASVHVSNILSKLGVATRVEAAALAHRRGLMSGPAEE